MTLKTMTKAALVLAALALAVAIGWLIPHLGI